MTTSAPSATLDATSASFVAHLVTLRDHYQGLLAEQERNILYLQQTVNNLNGLLENPLFPSPGEGVEALNGLGLTASLGMPQASAPKKGRKSSAKTSRKTGSKISGKVKATSRSQGKSQGARGKGPETILPLLPEFAGLSKINAVAKILSAHAGQVLHIDQIIQLLLGDLTEADVKAERGRIKDTLYRGAQEDRWVKFQGKPQSYTLDESLLDKTVMAASASVESVAKPTPGKKRASTKTGTKTKRSTRKSQKTTASKGKSKGNQSQWRPAYVGQSLTAAVAQILKGNRGKVMTAETIAEELFQPEQQFSQQDWAAIKKQIGTVLSKGLSLKQWQRMAKQRGAYVLR